MLNAAAIATSLAGLVGWHPAAEGNPEGPYKLLPAQLTSRSGLFVNDLNELLTLQVIADAKPESEALSSFIQRLTTDALLRLTGRLAQSQGLDGKVLLSDQPLLLGPGRAGDTVNKLGRFVGIRVSVANLRGVAFSVPRLTLQLDTVQATPLNIYLYTDADPSPVKVVTLPAGNNKPNYPYRFELEGDNALAVAAGGWAYIGYYEDDLTGRAIQREFTGGACGCSADPYLMWGPYLRAKGFAVPAANLNADRTADSFAWAFAEEASTFGLDLQFTGYCNVAAALQGKPGELTGNQVQLAPIVQLALGIRFLEALISSPNITQVTQREAVQADAYALLTQYQARLYGGKDAGTDEYYPSLLKAVSLDLSGLDAKCKPQKPSLLSMGTLSR